MLNTGADGRASLRDDAYEAQAAGVVLAARASLIAENQRPELKEELKALACLAYIERPATFMDAQRDWPSLVDAARDSHSVWTRMRPFPGCSNRDPSPF